MIFRIDQNVVWFDISMGNWECFQVVDCFEHLECIDFDEERWNVATLPGEWSIVVVKILLEVVDDNIQVLLVALFGVVIVFNL